MFKNRCFSAFYFFVGLFLLFSCNNPSGQNNRLPADIIANPNTAMGTEGEVRLPALWFEKDVHDFGRLIEGEKVSYSFKFTNSGNSLLLISAVSSSCGCTVPKYPDTPIKPGEGGVITVSFDSKGRAGMQAKTVTIISNTQPNSRILTIKATVVAPESMN